MIVSIDPTTGVELGSYGLKEFVNIKSLWIGPAR